MLRLHARRLLLTCLVVSVTTLQAQSTRTPDVLVSRQLAESEHLAIGQVIRLSPHTDGTDARTFRIAGIYEPTADPQRLGTVPRKVRLHLPDLLDLTRTATQVAGTDPVDGINIRLARPDDADAFIRDVNGRMPGVGAVRADLAGNAIGTFTVVERFHYAIATVTILAATIFLLALTIMLVDERRETVGILRLIGLPVGRILSQILLEGVLVATAGAAFGLTLALGSQRLLNRFFQWKYDSAMQFVGITPHVASLCVSIAVPLGAVATVLASWALLRRNGLRLVRR
jgi:predicted lysophospholipase L1 biosynthesis ABC-type transport system permease subunit